MFYWHRSCHGNVMTPLRFQLAFLFLGTRTFFSEIIIFQFLIRRGHWIKAPKIYLYRVSLDPWGATKDHQCDPGSNPGVDSKRSYSLLLVLSFASRGFSPDTPVFPFPQKPTLPNSNSILNAQTRLNEFIRTPKCFVGKQITIYNLQPAILRENIYKYRREEGAWIGVWNNRHSWTQVFFWLEFANIFTSGQG